MLIFIILLLISLLRSMQGQCRVENNKFLQSCIKSINHMHYNLKERNPVSINVTYDKNIEILRIMIGNHSMPSENKKIYYQIIVWQIRNKSKIICNVYNIRNDEAEIFIKQPFDDKLYVLQLFTPNSNKSTEFKLADIRQTFHSPAKCIRNGSIRDLRATLDVKIEGNNLKAKFNPKYNQLQNLCLRTKIFIEICPTNLSSLPEKLYACWPVINSKAMKSHLNNDIFSVDIHNLTYYRKYLVQFVVKAECPNPFCCEKYIGLNEIITIGLLDKPTSHTRLIVSGESKTMHEVWIIIGIILFSLFIIIIIIGLYKIIMHKNYMHQKIISDQNEEINSNQCPSLSPLLSLNISDLLKENIEALITQKKIKTLLLSCMKTKHMKYVAGCTAEVFKGPLHCEVVHATSQTAKRGTALNNLTLWQDWVNIELQQTEVVVVLAPDTNLEDNFMNLNYQVFSEDEEIFRLFWEKLRTGRYKKLWITSFRNMTYYPVLKDVRCNSFELMEDLGLLFKELHKDKLRRMEESPHQTYSPVDYEDVLSYNTTLIENLRQAIQY